MSQIASISTQAAAACLHARIGAFVLAPAQALTLRPQESSMLRITCGNAWVTLGDGLDYFLTAEQSLPLPKGSRMVMESSRPGAAVKFDWQPVRQTAVSLRPLFAQAWLDLRCAAGLTARGLTGLARAAALVVATTLGLGLLAGLAARARKALSSASLAH
jgi:hypothetical protein